MNITLGKQIRALRLRDGRTQEEVAEALGMSPQAVSRWEKEICYPDMELIPAIANYFGVSIDSLFGYDSERARRLKESVERIRQMNRENNGEDVSLDACIALARETAAEFPGNGSVQLALADVLYNAGYVRHGERHYDDAEGYDRFDTALHSTYPEWREAAAIYEKLLTALPEGEERQEAVVKLVQLYANTGAADKARAVAAASPGRNSSREMLLLNACDGKERAARYGETLLLWVRDAAQMMVSCLIGSAAHLTPEECAGIVERAIGLFSLVCPDGEFGMLRADIAGLELYRSTFLWRMGRHDEAFAALEEALQQERALTAYDGRRELTYTAPGLRLVKINPEGKTGLCRASGLPSLWPTWCVPSPDDVAQEMQNDPRWADWCARCGEA